MYCANCGIEIPDDCSYCPSCGKAVSSNKSSNIKVVIIFISACLVGAIFILLVPNPISMFSKQMDYGTNISAIVRGVNNEYVIDGNMLYYETMNETVDGTSYSNAIKRVDVNSGDETVLYELPMSSGEGGRGPYREAYYSNLTIYKKRLYFTVVEAQGIKNTSSNISSTSHLDCIDLDNFEHQIVMSFDDTYYDMQIFDDKVWFSKNGSICNADLNGENPKRICDEYSKQWVISDGYIYFTTSDNYRTKILRYSIANDSAENILNDDISVSNVTPFQKKLFYEQHYINNVSSETYQNDIVSFDIDSGKKEVLYRGYGESDGKKILNWSVTSDGLFVAVQDQVSAPFAIHNVSFDGMSDETIYTYDSSLLGNGFDTNKISVSPTAQPNNFFVKDGQILFTPYDHKYLFDIIDSEGFDLYGEGIEYPFYQFKQDICMIYTDGSNFTDIVSYPIRLGD